MSDILKKIVGDKREEISTLQRERPPAQVREQALARPPALEFAAALRGARPRGSGGEANIIAELKRRSPSKGEFSWHGDVARQVRDYEQGGARAISVLTDARYFGGSLELLEQVKSLTGLPVIQKEFVLDAYQVHLARAIGADAVLLIARILPGGLLEELVHLAKEIGIATLVEVVDGEELNRAGLAGAEVVGVNNRDLSTFKTDLRHTLELLPAFSEDQVAITESGIRTRADVERMLEAGVDGFLIGEALMVASHPAAHLRELRGEPPGEQPAEAAS